MRLADATSSRWLACVGALAMFAAAIGASAQHAATRPAGAATTRPARADHAWTAVNPHGSGSACRHCHQMSGDKAMAIPDDQVDAVCLKCHDGRQAPQERHPVGRTFASKSVTRPADYPAVNDRLGCMTCHDIFHSDHPEGGRQTDNPAFLRGEPGAPLLAFCGTCHAKDASQRPYNPHRMVTSDGHRNDAACTFCHTSAFGDERLMSRTGDAKLRGGPLLLCAGCHHEHPDFFSPGHIGHKVGRQRLAYMVAAERAAPGTAVDPAAIQRARDTGERPSRLPLGAGDTIVCSTCHNPHQQGTFPPGSALGAGGQLPDDASQRLPFRGLDKDLCRACHAQ